MIVDPKKIAEGEVSGFKYLVRTGCSNVCALCGRKGQTQPLLLTFHHNYGFVQNGFDAEVAFSAGVTGATGSHGEPPPGWNDGPTGPQGAPGVAGAIGVGMTPVGPVGGPRQGICEPCSYLARWIFGTTQDAAIPPSAFATEVSSATVLILRESPSDPANPYQALMVARKDDTSVFALPGGKLEKHEDADDAAVRELFEETGVHTWKSALEPLYLGYSPRGSLVRTYLCRAYHGEPKPKETPVAWKNWNVAQLNKTAHYRGYYMGSFEAARARILMQKVSRSTMSLSTSLSASAAHYTSLYLRRMMDEASVNADELSLMEGFRYAIKGNESEVIDLIISTEEKRLELPVRGLPPPGVAPKPILRRAAKVEEEEEEEAEDGDDGVVAEEADDDGGFVRPPPPKQE